MNKQEVVDGLIGGRVIDCNNFKVQILDNLMNTVDKLDPSQEEPKTLIVPEFLKPLIRLIVEPSEFKRRNLSLLYLTEQTLEDYKDKEECMIVFLIPPCKSDLEKAVRFITNAKFKGLAKTYDLIFFPQRTSIIKYVLKKEEYDDFFDQIYDLNFDLVPYAADLLSLDYKKAVKEMFIQSEYNQHQLAAESLFRIENIFGSFKSVLLKGKNSKIVFDIFSTLEKDNQKHFTLPGKPILQSRILH